MIMSSPSNSRVNLPVLPVTALAGAEIREACESADDDGVHSSIRPGNVEEGAGAFLLDPNT